MSVHVITYENIISFEFNDIMAAPDRCLNPFQYFKAKIVIFMYVHINIKRNNFTDAPHNFSSFRR